MNIIPAQEVKRCGISAVDEALERGPVHIIKNNRPQYVVLTEEHFQAMLEVEQNAAIEQIRTSLDDLQAGRTSRYSNVDSLMQQLESDEEK